MTTSHLQRSLRILALALTAVLAPTQAHAQSSEVQLANDQIDLINKGAQASNDGEYLAAVRFLKKALSAGDNDITRLNLGRAYQRAGLCDDALEMFTAALTAPHAAGVDADDLRRRAHAYAEETRQTCPGTLDLKCNLPMTEITVTDAQGLSVATFRCAARPPRLKPGSYTVDATFEGRSSTHTVAIQAMTTASLSISFPTPERAQNSTDAPPDGVPIMLGLTWAPAVGWATGPLYAEDGDTPFDGVFPNGYQDDLSGVQICRLAHVFELDATWVTPRGFAGLLAHAQLPLPGLDAGVHGGARFTQGPWEERLRLQTTYGELLQPMSHDDQTRFAARSGPVWIGLGASLSWWLHARVAATAGLDLRAGIPDLGVLLTANAGLRALLF